MSPLPPAGPTTTCRPQQVSNLGTINARPTLTLIRALVQGRKRSLERTCHTSLGVAHGSLCSIPSQMSRGLLHVTSVLARYQIRRLFSARKKSIVVRRGRKKCTEQELGGNNN